jgi:CRP-like cAMP-binding protein
MADQQLDMINRVPLFQGLNGKHLRSISEKGRRVSFETGEKIVRKGEPGDGLYLILEGDVEVRSGNRVLATIGKNNFFGEIALLDKKPRSADIVAVSPTTCFLITANSFERTIQKEPKIVFGIMKELSRRLRGADMRAA